MKAVAIAPVAVESVLAGGTAASPSPVAVHRAYPVTYGSVLCFRDPKACGCGWRGHQ